MDIDRSLIGLTEYMKKLPSGTQRGVFTQCVEIAIMAGNGDLMISHVPALIQRYKLQMPGTNVAPIAPPPSTTASSSAQTLKNEDEEDGGFLPSDEDSLSDIDESVFE